MNNSQASVASEGKYSLLNVQYIGIVFSDATTQRLLSEFGPYIPDGWISHATHHTLVHRADKGWADHASSVIPYLGMSVPVSIQYLGSSDKAVALGVESCLPCIKTHPHITLAVSPGSKPVQSNNITDWISIPPKVIFGTVEVIR